MGWLRGSWQADLLMGVCLLVGAIAALQFDLWQGRRQAAAAREEAVVWQLVREVPGVDRALPVRFYRYVPAGTCWVRVVGGWGGHFGQVTPDHCE